MEEYTVRAAPKVVGKKYNVFKMHKDDDLSWTDAKMRRDNDYQPWQIKLGSGRAARRFKAIKEGSVGENASYFIFYKPKDSKDTYEVRPIDEWYNVSATQRYKTLTAEEAEQKFEQRHKTLNLFSVMVKKNGDAGEEGGSAADSKAFKISEMDDWDRSGDDFSDSENERDGDDDTKTKKKKTKTKKEKEDPDNPPEEGKEDSDEGDFEQREVDYMSDSSSDSSISESGQKDETDVKGIAEMEALRDLLSTDDEEEAEGSPRKKTKPISNKNSLGTLNGPQDPDEEESEDSSDSDYDVDEDKMDSIFMKKSLPAQLIKHEVGQDQNHQGNYSPSIPTTSAATPTTSTASKRKLESATPSSSGQSATPQSPPKRPCPSDFSSSPANSHEKMIEDLIKKYLSRKPMTLRQILTDTRKKLKKMGGFTTEMDEELVNTIANILKRLNTDRQKINNELYLSLKA